MLKDDFASKKTVDDMASEVRQMNKKFKSSAADVLEIKQMLASMIENSSAQNTSPNLTTSTETVPSSTETTINSQITLGEFSGNPGVPVAGLQISEVSHLLGFPPSSTPSVSGRQALPIAVATAITSSELSLQAPSVSTVPSSANLTLQGDNLLHYPIMSECIRGKSQLGVKDNKISIYVPDSIRRKIMEGKYVDMAEMLQASDSNPNTAFALACALGMGELVQETKKNKVKDIKTWAKAFAKFKYYHTEYYPADARALDLYMFHILDLASDLADWEMFDTEFRKERASAAVKRDWDDYHNYLYNKAYAKAAQNMQSFRSQGGASKDKSSGSGVSNKKPRNEVPFGYCYQYHSSGKQCKFTPSCKYDHRCPKCKQDHPLCKHSHARNDAATKKESSGSSNTH